MTDTSARAPLATAGDVLPLLDSAGVLLAAAVAGIIAGTPPDPVAAAELRAFGWIAAALAPFVLYDARFAELAWHGAALQRRYAARLLALLGLAGALSFAGGWLAGAPPGWLAAAIATTVLATAVPRHLLALGLRRARPRLRAAAGAGRIADGLDVTVLAERPIRRWGAVAKVALDQLLAVLIAAALLPVLAAIALAIRLDSPGPVLFTQRRHGHNNTEFDIYKFRTMFCTPAAPGPLEQTRRGDRRVTRVGRFLRKWSLDELPQILNVLDGNMSLVGPRPHAVDMRTEQRLGHEITGAYPHRHRVRPGITGWSQVHGCRGATDTAAQLQRRVELDLYYIEHWSPLLDLKILVLTFREVLRGTNAY